MLSERGWQGVLAGGLLLSAGLNLGPVLLARPQAPQLTQVALPTPAPVPGATYPTTASVTPLISGKVNLNTASREQLEALPRVGPVLAEAIIAGRPYRSLEDLDQVKGVGEATLSELQPLVSW